MEVNYECKRNARQARRPGDGTGYNYDLKSHIGIEI
jgi:hypothetical protein